MSHTSTQMLLPGLADQASPAKARALPVVDYGRQNKRETFEATMPRHRGDRLRIVEALRGQPAGLTRHELAGRLGLPLTTVCGRVNELKQMGEARESGERRPTVHGRTATVVCYVGGDC
jgi:hypothetical protein